MWHRMLYMRRERLRIFVVGIAAAGRVIVFALYSRFRAVVAGGVSPIAVAAVFTPPHQIFHCSSSDNGIIFVPRKADIAGYETLECVYFAVGNIILTDLFGYF